MVRRTSSSVIETCKESEGVEGKSESDTFHQLLSIPPLLAHHCRKKNCHDPLSRSNDGASGSTSVEEQQTSSLPITLAPASRSSSIGQRNSASDKGGSKERRTMGH